MGRVNETLLLGMETGKYIVSPEEICKRYSGTWGPWQIRTFFIVSLVKVPSAWQMASILFTAANPTDFWCVTPSVNRSDDAFGKTTQALSRKNAEQCYVQEWMKDGPSNMLCQEFEYVSAETIITQWNLVCDRAILTSVSQFFYLFGILVGGIIAVFCIPRYGPRCVIISGMIFQIVTGVAIAYSPFLELKIFMRFLVACSCCNMFSAGYVICTDSVNSKTSRTVFACCYEHFWSLGVISLAMIAYLLPNWRDLQLALSVPTILILVCWMWIPNSVKWLLRNGRCEEARTELAKAASMNGLEGPPLDLSKHLSVSRSRTSSWLELIQTSGCIKMAALHVIWACTIVTYYGALLNVKNLGQHVVLNTIIAGLAEVVGVLIGLTLILNCGCKWFTLGIINLIGGLSCLFCWLIPQEIDLWQQEAMMVSLGMVGRITIAVSLTLLQVSSSELLEESFSQVGMFSCVTFARVFLLSAPFIGSLAVHGNEVSLSAFGSLTTLGGISALILSILPSSPSTIR